MKNIEITQVLKKLFASREISHVLHLGIQGEGSYATHKALETYYEEIPNLIDDLAEIFQGQFGIIDMTETMDMDGEKVPSDIIAYFEETVKFIMDSKSEIITEESSHLINNFDSIISLLFKTIYKLKNLK